jgi:hypothetical protein
MVVGGHGLSPYFIGHPAEIGSAFHGAGRFSQIFSDLEIDVLLICVTEVKNPGPEGQAFNVGIKNISVRCKFTCAPFDDCYDQK